MSNKNFLQNNNLVMRKMRDYLPTMILTNLSTFLIVSVDGLVVGNFVGASGLAAVNIVYPLILFIGTFSTLLTNGVSVNMMYNMGRNDKEAYNKTLCATSRLMKTGSVLLSILQIPLAFLIFNTFAVEAEVYDMVWLYAICMMVTTPMGIVSCMGIIQLRAYEKLKVIMHLTLLEGILNLIFDILFTAVLKWGIVGVGLGTVVASLVRAIVTHFCVCRMTPVYEYTPVKCNDQIVEILKSGVPTGMTQVLPALQNWVFAWLIVQSLGTAGIAVKSICVFGYSIAMVLINGVTSGEAMLSGLFYGTGNHTLVNRVLSVAIKIIVVCIGCYTLLLLLYPDVLYKIYGFEVVTSLERSSLRIYGTAFTFFGLVVCYATYFNSIMHMKWASLLNLLNGAIIIIPAALVIFYLVGGVYIWWSYAISSVISVLVGAYLTRKYTKGLQRKDVCGERISFSFKPTEGSSLADMVSEKFRNMNITPKLSHDIQLFIDELSAYVINKGGGKRPEMCLYLNLLNSKEANMVMVDDGRQLDSSLLDEHAESVDAGMTMDEVGLAYMKLIDDFSLLSMMGYKIRYQRAMNMNITTVEFR